MATGSGKSLWVEYKQLDKLLNVLLNVLFVGLTATATEKLILFQTVDPSCCSHDIITVLDALLVSLNAAMT
uniref:Uncharacterized protein n=1 Tax=Solanum tuberosum TaxID=4113 RepID=M1DLW7_SOLTU